MISPVKWDAECDNFGVRCKIVFFDESANAAKNIAQRIVPFMDASNLRYICGENDAKVFHFGQVSAEPDVLFELGAGYLCVEYKSRSGSKNPNIPRVNWQSALRLKEMLQIIITSRCVAATSGRVTACAIRYNNAFVLLVPPATLVKSVMSYVRFIPQEIWFRGSVASAKLASFAEVYVKEIYNKKSMQQETQAQISGRKAHEDMLSPGASEKKGHTGYARHSDEEDYAVKSLSNEMVINPATGLLMINGIGGLDTGGNTFGVSSMTDSMGGYIHDASPIVEDTSTQFFDSSSMFEDTSSHIIDSSSMFEDTSSHTIDSSSMFDHD